MLIGALAAVLGCTNARGSGFEVASGNAVSGSGSGAAPSGSGVFGGSIGIGGPEGGLPNGTLGAIGMQGGDASAAAPPLSDIPPVLPCAALCNDFPLAPILYSDGVSPAPPPDSAARFGAPGGTGIGQGPCILEPEVDSLFPRNWLRPRVHFSAGGGEDLFEVRIHTDREMNDLVAYTRASSFYVPKPIWTAVTSHVGTPWPFSVTVRGIKSTVAGAAPTTVSQSTFSIAPSTATGTIVYWTTSGGSALKGFSVGDENVGGVLTPATANGQCVGCHSSTPDGTFLAVSVTDDPANGDPARIELRRGVAPNDAPAFVSPAAKTLLARDPQHIPTFSKAHWSSGDHLMVSSFSGGPFNHTEVIWTDLEATSIAEGTGWGKIARNGDELNAAGYPAWSHDGQTIAYCSTPDANSSVNTISGNGKIYTVPFSNRAGATATPLTGAADPAASQFYPSWSADDHFVGFTRTPALGRSDDNALSEVFIVPIIARATAVRLAANDPPTCSGQKSPGATNSYPKWSPRAQTLDNKTYYWLVFSSRRNPEAGNNPQLYITGLVDNGGRVETHGAIYLWNQPANEANHTPAWDSFEIPPTPPPQNPR